MTEWEFRCSWPSVGQGILRLANEGKILPIADRTPEFAGGNMLVAVDFVGGERRDITLTDTDVASYEGMLGVLEGALR